MCHLQCKSSFFIYAWLTAWTWDRAIWLAACVAEVKNGNLWCVLLVPHPEDRCIVVRWAGCLLLAAAAAPTPSKPAEIWLCIVQSGSCLPRLLALVRAFLQLELWSCICTKRACWQVNASKRSCYWLWVNVSKQCLLASCCLLFLGLFHRIHPGPLHNWTVVTAEQSNGWKITSLIHCQENVFLLRLWVAKPTFPAESMAGLWLTRCSGRTKMINSKWTLIWNSTPDLVHSWIRNVLLMANSAGYNRQRSVNSRRRCLAELQVLTL